MKRQRFFLVIALALLLALLVTGCGKGYKIMTMQDARAQIEAGTDALILDVRPQEEFDAGHIPDAVLLPIDEIREGNFDPLPDKDREILVYCWTGRRDEDASQILVDEGYKNVVCIGGFVEWEMEEN